MGVQYLMCIFIILMVLNLESPVAPSDGVITPLPVWGPGYEVSFEFYLNSAGGGGYQYLFGVVGNADHTANDVAYGQPIIFYRNGKLPIWFALNGNAYGEAAGDTLDIWRFPYGGSVTIDVNKWHQVTVASVKEDGKVRRFAAISNFLICMCIHIIFYVLN